MHRLDSLSAALPHLPAVAVRPDQVRAIREWHTMDLPIVRQRADTAIKPAAAQCSTEQHSR